MSQGDLVDLTKWPSNWIGRFYMVEDGGISSLEAIGIDWSTDGSLEHIACRHGLYSVLEELIKRLETKRRLRWNPRRWYAQYQRTRQFRRRLNLEDSESRAPLSVAAE